MLDRLELQDVSTLVDDDTDGDDMAADIMDETGFAAVLKDIYAYEFAMGESYAMVVPGVEGGPTLSNGKPVPVDPCDRPAALHRDPGLAEPGPAACGGGAPVRPDHAGKHRRSCSCRVRSGRCATSGGMGMWAADASLRKSRGLDALGGIPIVRFENLNGLGEYEPHLDLLDRINDTTLQRIIGFWYQALRQRASRATRTKKTKTAPKQLPPVDWNKVFRAGPGALWKIPADFKIWESQQTDFSRS
jgi:hypothetical protein